MSERITEATLRVIEAHYGGSTGGATPIALVAELRRLRGLILGLYSCWDGPMPATDEHAAFESEARAISEEQGP